VAGHAAQDEQVGQDVDDLGRFELAPDPDGQALVGELVDDVEQPELAPVVGAVLDEVVAPDVVGPLRAQPEAGAVGQPQAAALRQIRSTRLAFTSQPASRSSAVTLR
jgi:hypothetical protein